jgi:hypothetical protein
VNKRGRDAEDIIPKAAIVKHALTYRGNCYTSVVLMLRKSVACPYNIITVLTTNSDYFPKQH